MVILSDPTAQVITNKVGWNLFGRSTQPFHLLLPIESEIFFFVCFIVVLVGWSHGATSLWESIFELGKDAINPLLIVHVVHKRFAEDAPHDQKVRWIKMESRVHTTIRTHKGGFKCETVH